ncbi:MAG: 4'-phosphopantetheinyl transferase superfamily protein [Prevotella sp.]|nr:4'-phosphopantetheinyl transferase superfamily protein [Prevotella sp.]
MMKFRIIDDFATDSVSLQRVIDSLPAWRKEAAMKYKHEQGRCECAFSYQLLCDMVGFQPDFLIGEHGKPYVKPPFSDSQIFFNLSHCRNAIACVIGDGEVGIDVECTGRYKERLARYCMCDEEMDAILSADEPDAVFTMLWTKKEALLKLTGEGITDDMKGCLYSERMQGVSIESGFDADKGYAWSVASYK